MTLINNSKWSSLLLFILAGGLFVILFRHYGLDWTVSISDALISAGILTLTVWGGTLAVNNYPTKVGLLVYALLAGIAAGFIAWTLDRFLLKWWFATDAGYLSWLQQTHALRLVIALITTSWLITLRAVQRQATVLEDQFKTLTDAATLHREAELFKLRQQLQPHFLYNSLNSIAALIMIAPEKAQEMIGRLSDFLRHSVKREGREEIPVDEELTYIEAYLAIEVVRFGDRLHVVYKKAYTDDATIPPFLLQPVLENAIKFGLYGKTGNVEIQVDIALQEAFLVISINNPYDPGNRPPSGTGFGLEGIRRRLYLLYARTDLLETRRQNELFTTTLKIPQNHVQGNFNR